MIIRDDSGRSIELTLWGAMATGSPGDQIMAVSACAPSGVLFGLCNMCSSAERSAVGFAGW